MRILHITWSADKAGMLAELVQEQKQDRGLELDVCFGIRENGIYADQIEQMGIHPKLLGMKSRYLPIQNIRGGLRLRQIIREGNYDIIHLQEAMIPFPFLAATARWPNVKVVLHNRGEFNFTETPFKRLGQRAKTIIYRQLVPGRIDKLICNSHFTVGKTPLPQIHLQKVEVLYNAIDLKKIRRILLEKEQLQKNVRREQGLAKDAFLVTTVARLVEFKRIDRFITGFAAAARSTGSKLTALIVGGGPLAEALKKKVLRAGLADRIRLVGHRFDAKEIIAASDLFVLPSAGEAFGIAALEAVALGVPTIIFGDAGGPLEFIIDGENGFIVKDELELGNKISVFSERRIFLNRSSIGSIRAWDISTYAKRIREIYGELMQPVS